MIEILPAAPQDAALLAQIALASKGYWGYPEEQLQSWALSGIITPAAIASSRVFVARQSEAALGWYRLRLGNGKAELEDLWVLPAWIGRGLGRRLFEHAVQQARLGGAAAIELDADPNALAFYQHMGCQVIGEWLSEWGRLIPRLRFKL